VATISSLAIVPQERLCAACNKILPIASFRRHARIKDGWSTQCIDCVEQYRLSLRLAHPIERTEKRCRKCNAIKPIADFHTNRRNRDGRQNSCADCCRADTKRFRDINRQRDKKSKEKSKNEWLWFSYRIRLSDYSRMLLAQNGTCAICGSPPKSGTVLVVDHNHETKKVRGLLCASCNWVLGNARESSSILRKAADYLDGDLENK
jgi:phage FluMu protein Com